jgi:tRNA (cmo5U34)-methyltransferase
MIVAVNCGFERPSRCTLQKKCYIVLPALSRALEVLLSDLLSRFSDPAAVASYAEGPPQFVPGFRDLHRMAAILIAERAPGAAGLLVLGAGGGLELKAFAEAHPNWTFDGVDPAAEMLKLAQSTLGPLASRARLIRGYIDDAPLGPYDAATCLLTLHFLPADERLGSA